MTTDKPSKAASHVVNHVAAKAGELAVGGLRSYLPTAELEIRLSDEYDIVGRGLILAPLFESSDFSNMVFAQASLSRFGDRTTGNIGLGYRHLAVDETVLLGVNSFYDYEWPYDHSRASIGGEIRSTVLEVNANHYFGLSPWRDTSDGFQERAMGGYDVEAAAPLPYLPRTRLSATYFKWKSQGGGFSDDGWTYALEAEAGSGLTFEVGHTSYDAAADSNFVAVRLNVMDLLEPVDEAPFVASRAYELASMKDKRYDKVRRENLIRKERQSITSSSFVVTVSGF